MKQPGLEEVCKQTTIFWTLIKEKEQEKTRFPLDIYSEAKRRRSFGDPKRGRGMSFRIHVNEDDDNNDVDEEPSSTTNFHKLPHHMHAPNSFLGEEDKSLGVQKSIEATN
ncbi:hypothetical protein CR513_05516, partial [Mucuna pruriens]